MSWITTKQFGCERCPKTADSYGFMTDRRCDLLSHLYLDHKISVEDLKKATGKTALRLCGSGSSKRIELFELGGEPLVSICTTSQRERPAKRRGKG